MMHDIGRDQREGRPSEVTGRAACVLDSRHRTMAERIAAAVRAGEKPFVIVGRAHLMGSENLIPPLQARGLVPRQID
jgi:uncharacterized protein YbaP (TraB family)